MRRTGLARTRIGAHAVRGRRATRTGVGWLDRLPQPEIGYLLEARFAPYELPFATGLPRQNLAVGGSCFSVAHGKKRLGASTAEKLSGSLQLLGRSRKAPWSRARFAFGGAFVYINLQPWS